MLLAKIGASTNRTSNPYAIVEQQTNGKVKDRRAAYPSAQKKDVSVGKSSNQGSQSGRKLFSSLASKVTPHEQARVYLN